MSKCKITLECDENTKKKLSEALRSKQIEDQEEVYFIDESAIRLYRIFSEGSFKRGGRFYRGWWQQVPQRFRKYIHIDGQKTVELDYSRFHISILYAELGVMPPADSYKIHSKVSEKITKYAINAMLNAKGIVKPHKDFDEEDCGIPWEGFIKLIEKKHKAIVENGYWNTGCGLTLQFKDSLIAEKILLHFAKKDIPCLPIHDSFIIAESFKGELKETMLREYQERFGTDIMIKQKV